MRLLITITLMIAAFAAHGQWYLSEPTQKSAFGFEVVVEPYTLFDMKVLNDKQPLFWDEELINGAAASYHSVDSANVRMTTDSVTEAVIRQTYMRIPYEPGKGQRIMYTGIMEPTTGTVKRYGYFNSGTVGEFADSLDGVYFKSSNDTMYVCNAQLGTETCVAQSSWNKNTGLTGADSIEWDKAQVFYITFGWLGYRGATFGIIQNGKEQQLHDLISTNNTTTPFMSSPNHSLRGEIRQTAAAAGTNTLTMGCQSVQSDGGIAPRGILRNKSSAGAQFTLAVEDSTYALYGIRLKDAYRDRTVLLKALDFFIGTSNDYVNYEVWLNPPISGTFTYAGEVNSGVEIATGTGTTYVLPGGTRLTGGFVNSSSGGGGGSGTAQKILDNAKRIGVAINGTKDYIVIAGTPISGAASVGMEVSFDWQEF